MTISCFRNGHYLNLRKNVFLFLSHYLHNGGVRRRHWHPCRYQRVRRHPDNHIGSPTCANNAKSRAPMVHCIWQHNIFPILLLWNMVGHVYKENCHPLKMLSPLYVNLIVTISIVNIPAFPNGTASWWSVQVCGSKCAFLQLYRGNSLG